MRGLTEPYGAAKGKKSNKKVMSASIKTVLSASVVDLSQLQQEMQRDCQSEPLCFMSWVISTAALQLIAIRYTHSGESAQS